RLIHQDADGQGHPAQRHDVNRVARQPQADQRADQRQRDVEDDDDDAAPVAQEQQDHQARQAGADGPLGPDAPDRLAYGGRLVELEIDGHVLGYEAAEEIHRLADVRHDLQCRGVALLDDRQVAAGRAVDQGVAIVQVGGVLDGGDVADVDVPPQLQRD